MGYEERGREGVATVAGKVSQHDSHDRGQQSVDDSYHGTVVNMK